MYAIGFLIFTAEPVEINWIRGSKNHRRRLLQREGGMRIRLRSCREKSFSLNLREIIYQSTAFLPE